MKKHLIHGMRVLVAGLMAAPSVAVAEGLPDSARVVDLEEVVIIATPKETGKLRQQAGAVSLIGQDEMSRDGITSLKGVTSVVPNLFIPDYGSRLTSAIYIRGIGSRINTPAVGLYVDNMPYYDKSAFDFNLYDIERIDVLRGPQGTLYGRNSMGGLVRIHTRSPFDYQGTDIKLGMATGDTHRNASLTHYHRISDQFAFSAGGYYEGSSGFHHNSYSGKRQDKMESGGGRLRAIYRPGERLSFDFNVGYDYSHEGGYPYFYLGQVSGEETHADLIGRISANEESSYTRGMLNTGLNVEYRGKGYTLNSVTSFQHLEDRMFMDQDFISDDIYTLEQKQKLSILGEELTIKSTGRRTWQWVNGITASKQWLRTTGPVTFKSDGITMLQNNIDGYMPDLSSSGISSMSVSINDEQLTMGGRFQTPVTNLAAFHQSTVNLTRRLAVTIGLRVDYEHNSLTYNAPATINYDFSMQSGRMPLNLTGLQASPLFVGKLDHDYVEHLPKVAVKYDITDEVMVYASAAKGHRAGGYNVQMFSELLQSAMRNTMMQGIQDGVNETLDGYAAMGMPSSVIDMIRENLKQMPMGEETDVESTVRYKPEYSWNLEVGTHATLLDRKLTLDVALFYSTIRDQQISRFTENGLGRMMVNAGRSRSYGLELSARYAPVRWLNTWLNYGYTNATFTNYDAGSGTDYTGNYVPFIPKHTMNLGADFNVTRRLTLGLDMKANGRIYWTEDNNASQSLYTTFGAHALYDFGAVSVNVWGRNLTNKHYQSFYFESMSRRYAQKGRPLQLGFDINVKI